MGYGKGYNADYSYERTGKGNGGYGKGSYHGSNYQPKGGKGYNNNAYAPSYGTGYGGGKNQTNDALQSLVGIMTEQKEMEWWKAEELRKKNEEDVKKAERERTEMERKNEREAQNKYFSDLIAQQATTLASLRSPRAKHDATNTKRAKCEAGRGTRQTTADASNDIQESESEDEMQDWEKTMAQGRKKKPRAQKVRPPCDPSIWSEWTGSRKDIGKISKIFGRSATELKEVNGNDLMSVADMLCESADMEKVKTIAKKTSTEAVPARWAKRDIIIHVLTNILDNP